MVILKRFQNVRMRTIIGIKQADDDIRRGPNSGYSSHYSVWKLLTFHKMVKISL